LSVPAFCLWLDRQAPCNVEVENAWSYTSTPTYVFMAHCLNSAGTVLPLPYVTSFFQVAKILCPDCTLLPTPWNRWGSMEWGSEYKAAKRPKRFLRLTETVGFWKEL